MPRSETIKDVQKYVSNYLDVSIDNVHPGGILYKDGSYVVSYDMNAKETLEKYTSHNKTIKYFYAYIDENQSDPMKTITQPPTTISPTTSTSAPDIKNNAGFVIGIGLSVLVIVIAFVIYVCQKELNESIHPYPSRKSKDKETEDTTRYIEAGTFTNYDEYAYSAGYNTSRTHNFSEKYEMYHDYGRQDINSYIRSCVNSYDLMSPLIDHPASPYAEFLTDSDGFEILTQIYP